MSVLVDASALREVLDLPEAEVPDQVLDGVCAAVDAAVLPRLTGGAAHTPHENCREAGLGIAVQVWQSRHAPGGQMTGLDMGMMTTPHLLGRGLVDRFSGLLAPCLAFGGAGIA